MAKKNEFNDKPVPRREVKVLTVDDLYEELAIARKNGLGKRKVLLSNDDEGNGYHYCFFSVTEITDDFFGFGSIGVNETKENLKKNFVIVG